MRITTRAVFQMTDAGLEELERDSYEYDGPVAQAGSGSSGGDTTTTSEPWSKLQPYVEGAAGRLDAASQQPNQYYGGPTVAPFNPAQQQGQQGAMDYAGGPQLGNVIGGMQGAVNRGTSGAYMDPNQNSALGMSQGMYNQFSDYGNDPALQNAQGMVGRSESMMNDPYSDPTIKPWLDAAIRPITENYQENVMPGIADQAEMYGGAGSRTGLAEGVASRGYMDAVGSASAGVMNNAFNRGMDYNVQAGQQLGQTYGQAGMLQQGAAGQYGQNYGQGMTATGQMASLAPGAAQLGMMPSQIQQGVGAQQQAQTQMEYGANQAEYNYNRDADFNRSQDYFSTLQGTPWGSSNSSGGDAGGTSFASGAMGGAAMGAGLGAMTGTPFGWGAGAIGGGILGGAMSIWG